MLPVARRALVLGTSVAALASVLLATSHTAALAAWAVDGTHVQDLRGADLVGPDEVALTCQEDGDALLLTASWSAGSTWAQHRYTLDSTTATVASATTSAQTRVPRTPTQEHAFEVRSAVGSWSTSPLRVVHVQDADGGCHADVPVEVVEGPGTATGTATATATTTVETDAGATSTASTAGTEEQSAV